MTDLKIVLAFDSFKGSLCASEVTDCVQETFKAVRPDVSIKTVLMSDGGEGLLESVSGVLTLERKSSQVTNPLGQSCLAHYGFNVERKLAVIESAQACGLTLIDAEKRNPLHTTAYGVGELILDALESGAKTILMGLGGSATNEAGLSILQALGAKFFDGNNQALSMITGKDLEKICRMDLTGLDHRLFKTQIMLACDVNNPLIGLLGATFVYGPQKGGTAETLQRLEQGMENVASLIEQTIGISVRALPGAGAAGGIAAGLHAALGATLQSGINIILDLQDFEEKIQDADLVITGEGKSDAQTLMGKVPMGILRRAQKKGIPVILVSGAIENCTELLNAGFAQAIAIKPLSQSIEEAMQKETAHLNLQNAIRKYFDL